MPAARAAATTLAAPAAMTDEGPSARGPTASSTAVQPATAAATWPASVTSQRVTSTRRSVSGKARSERTAARTA
jgi:hypothetical protein